MTAVASIAARCSCGEWGPFVDSREVDPVAALVREHGVTEPTACADCGHVTPVDPTKPPEWRAPWRRYQPIEDDGTWRYVCSDRAACQQRQLAPPRETDSDPLTAVVGGWSTFTVSLDLSGEWAHTVGGLDEAIANFQHVRANCPRRWDQIGPEDRRALTALAAAVEAIQEAVDTAQHYAPLPALKAGGHVERHRRGHGGVDRGRLPGRLPRARQQHGLAGEGRRRDSISPV